MATDKHCFALLSVAVLLIKLGFASEDVDEEVSKLKVELPDECGDFPRSLRFHHRHYDRISSGYDAKQAQFPSYVQLISPRPRHRKGMCGGTLISDRHILTAAHCLNGTVADKPIKIGLGVGGVKGSNRVYETKQRCVSSMYRRIKGGPHSVYDVGIVRLNESIEFDHKVQPACLPRAPLEMKSQAYAIGLGGIGKDPRHSDKLVKPSRLQVLPVVRVKCDHRNRHKSVMCSKFNDPTYSGMVCHGDSGGPLLALDDRGRQTVFGVSSYGVKECGQLDELSGHASGYFVDVLNIRSEIDRLLEVCS